MKKIIMIAVILSLLIGCGIYIVKEQQDTYITPEIIEDESYEFSHGIIDYNFETWSYNGEPLEFEYFVQNVRSDCEFGIMFLIDGIPQTYDVDGQETKMYTLDMKAGEKQEIAVTLSPQIASTHTMCNLHAYVILNPSTIVTDAMDYEFNHSVSSTATVPLEMKEPAIDESITVQSVDTTYEELPEEVKEANIVSDINMLESNIYCQINEVESQTFPSLDKEEPVSLSVYGKGGEYRILMLEDNIVTNIYDLYVEDNQYATVSLELEKKETTNVYFLVVPVDVAADLEYLLIAQSKRCIVSDREEGEDKKERNAAETLLLSDYIITDIGTNEEYLVLFYSANGNTEIAPTKFVIADIETYEILYEVECDKTFVAGEITILEDGFYINQGTKLMVYDYELNVIQEIDLEDYTLQSGVVGAFAEFRTYPFALSSDRKKAAYINETDQTLVVYDFETEEETVVYQLADGSGDIFDFESLYLMGDYIGFSGCCRNEENINIQDCNIYGRIQISTGKIDGYIKNGIATENLGDMILVVDVARVEESDVGSGETILYDVEMNEETIVGLETSYTSFDVELAAANLIVSYNDIGREQAKLLVYQNEEEREFEEVIPGDTLTAGSCYDIRNDILLVFYTVPDGGNIRSCIEEVELADIF